MEIKQESVLVGTTAWCAPEVILDYNYNQQCDIYSAGIVLFNLLTNQIPFKRSITKSNDKDGDLDDIYKMLTDNNSLIWQDYQRMISPNSKVQDLIIKMINNDYSKRITINDIFKHEWCNDNNTRVQK